MELGFIDIGYKTVYCNRRCEGALWYTVKGENQIPIHNNAIRGRVERLEIVSLQRRGKETDKLQLTMDCGDWHYVLEAGAESEFAQSLVYNLATLTPDQLRQPIIIQPEPGEDSAVLFACVRTMDYKRVFVEREKAPPYQKVLERAIANITKAGGNQPKEQVNRQAIDLMGEFNKLIDGVKSEADLIATYEWVQANWNAIAQVPKNATYVNERMEAQQARFAPTQDLSDVIAETDVEMRRLGWDAKKGREFLKRQYGKRSRQELDEGELRDFLNYLKAQPTPQEDKW